VVGMCVAHGAVRAGDSSAVGLAQAEVLDEVGEGAGRRAGASGGWGLLLVEVVVGAGDGAGAGGRQGLPQPTVPLVGAFRLHAAPRHQARPPVPFHRATGEECGPFAHGAGHMIVHTLRYVQCFGVADHHGNLCACS